MFVIVGIAADFLCVSSRVSLAAPTLLGGIGFGSSTNRGRVITIDQTTAAGAVLSGPGVSPDAGLNGLTFDSSGALYDRNR